MRRRLPFFRSVLALSAALVLALGLALAFVRIDRVVVASGHLSGGSRAVRAPYEGRVEHVLAQPGQRVRKGDALVILSVDDLRAERERSEAQQGVLAEELARLGERRRHLTEEEHPGALELAELELARAEVARATSESRTASYASLQAEGLVATLAYEEAASDLAQAELELSAARLSSRRIEERQRLELADLDAELRQVAGQLEDRRLQVVVLARHEREATLTAPADGVCLIAAPDHLLGRRVLSGEELARVAYGAADRFEGLVSDTGRVHVHSGDQARLRIEGYPWMLHGSQPGRVTYLADTSAGDGGFPVTVELLGEGPEAELLEGMRAEARILVEARVSLTRLLFERVARSDGR